MTKDLNKIPTVSAAPAPFDKITGYTEVSYMDDPIWSPPTPAWIQEVIDAFMEHEYLGG